MARNPQVDEWFADKDHPIEDAMQAVRSLALADPRVSESIKWARTMRFADLADVEAHGDALASVIESWCEWKDDR